MGSERARLERMLRSQDVPATKAIGMHRRVNVLCEFLGHDGKSGEEPPSAAQHDEL
jgi:hypothetical protein